MVVRIYFEGGRHLRESFAKFFEELHDLARSRRGGLRLISCKATAIQDFMTALDKHPDQHVILLIDCEGPASECALANLTQRFQGAWKPPTGFTVSDDRVFRMTQIMESWFLADRDCLNRYYGQAFQASALPGHSNVEDAPKRDVLEGLKHATRNTQKGAYTKGSHDRDLLRSLNPDLVRAKSPGCKRLFSTLTQVLASS